MKFEHVSSQIMHLRWKENVLMKNERKGKGFFLVWSCWKETLPNQRMRELCSIVTCVMNELKFACIINLRWKENALIKKERNCSLYEVVWRKLLRIRVREHYRAVFWAINDVKFQHMSSQILYLRWKESVFYEKEKKRNEIDPYTKLLERNLIIPESERTV